MMAAGEGGGAGFLLFGLFILAAYLVPSIVAAARNHHQFGAIVVVNVLLGWTFVGWAVALAMACGAVKRAE
jgi:hypothetical protein